MQARMNSSDRAAHITMLGRSALVVSLVVAAGMPGTLWGQADVNLPIEPAAAPSQAVVGAETAGPFVAEITGNDVHIRSGPGTHFYHCGKLYSGDRVEVVKVENGWSGIVPPPGCFSWISMQYVSINLQNPTMGIVTGDDVGVYAGSDYVEPWNSTSKQVTLNRSENVRLLGEEKDDYYKIAPPKEAYLWVSSQYVQPLQTTVGESPVETEAAVKQADGAPPAEPKVATESDLLDTYYALSKLINAERVKPVAEQDYAELKKKLQKLAESTPAGRAARYAEFTLRHVDRFELACTVAKEIELQNKELTKVTEQIDEARATRLARIENLGKFAVIGNLESSSVYGAGQERRYRILNAAGKTICYIVPTGAAVAKDVSKLFGKKVGVVGQIRPHEATARAMVTFTEVILLEPEASATTP